MLVRITPPILIALALAAVPSAAEAQGAAAATAAAPDTASDPARTAAPDATQAPAPAQPEARPTGLPKKIAWTFNFDAGWGSFGFANSYYNNPKNPGVPEALSDQWFEGYVKPSLSASFTLASSSEVYGKVSAVGERTYGEVPVFYGQDVSSFGADDLAIGWRSGKSLEDLDENALDFSVGRLPYKLGSGMLIWDGASEGGSRGGYWTNARKAFAFGTVGRFHSGAHKVEGFYLDKDELPESNSDSRVVGANYEFTPIEHTTLGVTYMRLFADAAVDPGRDGLNVFDVRANTAPIVKVPDLSFAWEYAAERNGDALDSNAWTLEGAYELSKVRWTPTLSYRYAFFQGDDPATPQNEAFDSLFLGFSDWGSWWQGEIAGEYFLSNSNLISHMVRAHVSPSDAIGAGVIFFDFRIPKPAAYGPTVTDSHAAVETDFYMDWKLNTNFTLSLVGAFANPGKAVEQLSGRTKNFTYGMAYVAYAF